MEEDLEKEKEELFKKRFEYSLVLLGFLVASSYLSLISRVQGFIVQCNAYTSQVCFSPDFTPYSFISAYYLRSWFICLDALLFLSVVLLFIFVLLRGVYISQIFKSHIQIKVYFLADFIFSSIGLVVFLVLLFFTINVVIQWFILCFFPSISCGWVNFFSFCIPIGLISLILFKSYKLYFSTRYPFVIFFFYLLGSLILWVLFYLYLGGHFELSLPPS